MAEKNDGKVEYEWIVYDRTGEKTNVVAKGTVLAASQRTAEMTATREIPAEVDLDRVEVVVRPFR